MARISRANANSNRLSGREKISNRNFAFDDDTSNSDTSPSVGNNYDHDEKIRIAKAQALSMTFMKALSGLSCPDCVNGDCDENDHNAPSELYNLQAMQRSSSSISPLVSGPMMLQQSDTNQVESIIGEYMCLCQFYKVPYNAGILTTLRFSLPSLRVSGSFHDTDMLALSELLLRHANARLQFVSRLDFIMASKEGKQHRSVKLGFTSHGALALAKVLQHTKYIRQIWLPRHRIGPYGASALFLACRDNPSIQTLNLRRCRIGERGAFAFCELLKSKTGLLEVDLSANGIGHRGTVAIERAMERYEKDESTVPLLVNLEGNLVFPEIMNGTTHGLGVVLSIVGNTLMSNRTNDLTLVHQVSCGVYTFSLMVLYMSSTLFHSFFALQYTKYVFQVIDKCAIYILIAGSYTPFLQILLIDKPIWSIGLLGFIWMCCVFGICVEAFCPLWKYKGFFSLSLYLGMGWASVVVLPEFSQRLPQACINFLIMGGVGYTSGIPFFLRDNNLDHAIWHLFVMAGSIFHYLAIYIYVAPKPLPIY